MQPADVIVKAARAILPETSEREARFVLFGYDKDGKCVFGIGHKARSVASGVRWARSGERADLKRVREEYADWLAENP